MKISRWTSVRRLLATLVVVPALMLAVAPPTWAQGSTSSDSVSSARNRRPHHQVPEGGVLASLGIAMAVIASAAVYRRRRA